MKKREVKCPIQAFGEIMSSRWDWLIVRELMVSDRQGFNELMHSVSGISSRTLSQRLKNLHAAGIVRQKKIASNTTIPFRSRYSLTPLGKKLEPVLEKMTDWMKKYDRAVLAKLKKEEPVKAPRTK